MPDFNMEKDTDWVVTVKIGDWKTLRGVLVKAKGKRNAEEMAIKKVVGHFNENRVEVVISCILMSSNTEDYQLVVPAPQISTKGM